MLFLSMQPLDLLCDPHITARESRQARLTAMRFGCAVTAEVHLGKAPVYTRWNADKIIDLYHEIVWAAQPVVGWNITQIDLPIIFANAQRAGQIVLEIETETFRIHDLFSKINDTTDRLYDLDEVTLANLGRGKKFNNTLARDYLLSGQPDQIELAFQHCQENVDLCLDLYSTLIDSNSLMLPAIERKGYDKIRWNQFYKRTSKAA